MTVIAFDGHTLAADRMAAVGSSTNASMSKIYHLKNGDYAAAAGRAAEAVLMIKWIDEGAVYEDYPLAGEPDSTVIVISKDGVLKQYDGPVPLVLTGPFYAIGSGREYALAAMYLGHDARKAVEVANALCMDCGNGIDSVTLESRGSLH